MSIIIGGSKFYLCSVDPSHEVSVEWVVGQRGTYGVPFCPTDDPVPDIQRLADAYALRNGTTRAVELARL